MSCADEHLEHLAGEGVEESPPALGETLHGSRLQPCGEPQHSIQQLGGWDTTWRYRNRLEVQVAVNHDHLADDHTFYLLADAEAFINLGRAAEERFNDNWRIRSGLGYRLRYQWRFELLYTLQLSKDTLLASFETSNHILRLRLKFYPKGSPKQAIAAKRARN